MVHVQNIEVKLETKKWLLAVFCRLHAAVEEDVCLMDNGGLVETALGFVSELASAGVGIFSDAFLDLT